MTAPLINGRSPAAEDLHARLAYQCEANRILLATTRPPVEGRRRPIMTEAELNEMELAYTLGLTAAGFAARLAHRDRMRGGHRD